MLKLGTKNKLTILRHTSVGWYLSDGDEEVLLPTKYGIGEMEIDSEIEVFIHKDNEDRPIASTLEPKIALHQIRLLRVRSATDFGAYVDIGLSKDLLVPFREQKRKMEAGKSYLIMMLYDFQTDRLIGTNHIWKNLSNTELTVGEGDEVELTILNRTDLGRLVAINEQHQGLLFNSDIHAQLQLGEKITGYIHKIRPDQKIDVRLEPTGFENKIDRSEAIVLEKLEQYDGKIPCGDKSPPDQINDIFQMSKKQFKRTIGTLYKKKRIDMDSHSIWLVTS